MLAATGFVALVLPALASAYPVPNSQPAAQPKILRIPLTKRETFMSGREADVDGLHRHVDQVMNKLHRGTAAFEQNTGHAHPYKPSLPPQAHAQKRASGAVALTDDDGSMWFGTIDVGTPAHPYTVDFDTGSADLILPGPACGAPCDGLTLYDPQQSSSAHELNIPYQISYGDGSSTSGAQWTDTVAISGLSATNQTIGVAQDISAEFTSGSRPSDGMLGMAFPPVSVMNTDPLFQTLVNENQTDAPVFAFKLAGEGAELFVGGTDDAKYTGDFVYADVVDQGYWSINVDAVSNNGTSVQGVEAIVDTGTTLIVGDTDNVRGLYASINGSAPMNATNPDGTYMVPCGTLPTLSVTIGGKQWTVSADSFNKGSIPGQIDMCLGGLVSQDNLNFWILGDVFLENVYTAFDVGQKRVGFAALA